MSPGRAWFRSLLFLVLISGLLFPVAVLAYPIDGTYEIVDSSGEANGVYWQVQADGSYVSTIISWDKTFSDSSYIGGSIQGSLDGFQLTGNYNLDDIPGPHTIAITFNDDWSRFEGYIDNGYYIQGRRY
jgi:hypothetical protein